jgi:hypothetical protein
MGFPVGAKKISCHIMPNHCWEIPDDRSGETTNRPQHEVENRREVTNVSADECDVISNSLIIAKLRRQQTTEIL